MLLKLVDEHTSPVESDNVHAVYADVMSCSFVRHEDGSATARCYVRDEIKTAIVPGFSEHEKLIGFTGTAYLMNDKGRTVSSFTARTSGELVGLMRNFNPK
jgi:hypothetical protein